MSQAANSHVFACAQILQAQGKYQHKPPLPFTLGTEYAGVISHDSPIPEGSGLCRGQRVFGAQLGSFADKVAVDVDRVLPLPDNLTFDQGAGAFGFISLIVKIC